MGLSPGSPPCEEVALQKPGLSGEVASQKPSRSLEEVKQHSRREDCWLVLYGEVYDLTAYVPFHPGKDFLLQAAGTDATGLFESIHSSTGKALLRSEGFHARYHVGRLADGHSDFTFDDPLYQEISAGVAAHFREVKGTSWARGGPIERAVVYSKFVLILCLAAITKWRSVLGAGLFSSAMHGFCLLLVIFNVSHGACHGELILRYPTWFSRASQMAHRMIGTSAKDWMAWHNMSHHQHTNTNKDLDTNRGKPFFRLHEHDPLCGYMRYQHIYIWFIYPLTHLITFVGREARSALMHALVCNVLSCCLTGQSCVLALLVESLTFGFGFVMINHITHANDETEYHHHPGGKIGWGEHQIRSSSNWCMGDPLMLLLWGGINYQIEHHMFQSIHHVHYPALSRLVQSACAKRGVPYVAFPTYLSALASHHRLLVRMGAPP